MKGNGGEPPGLGLSGGTFLGRGWSLPLAQGRSYQNPHNQSYSECMHAKRGEGAQGRKNHLFPQPQNSWRNCVPLPGAAVTSVGTGGSKGSVGSGSPFPFPVHTPQPHGWQKRDGRKVFVDALRGQTVKGQVPSHFHMRTWAGDHEKTCRERSSK